MSSPDLILKSASVTNSVSGFWLTYWEVLPKIPKNVRNDNYIFRSEHAFSYGFQHSYSICFKSQIREQMCLETLFQYENSVLGRFGQSRLQREKNPNCHKYATFEGSVFYVFIGKFYFGLK